MILSTLCYLQKENSTLMMHRNQKKSDYHLGKWNGLGGKMEPGETPEECVIREVFEESGLNLLKPKWAGFLTWPKFDGEVDWYAFVFTGTQFDGDLRKSNPEGSLEWVPNHRVMALPLWEGDRVFMKWILEDRFFSARFEYVEGELKDFQVRFYDLAGEPI
jgi:8-oxo-dGTP diphosphatase